MYKVSTKGNKALTTTYLVYLALSLRLGYQFGHPYPGADRGVYRDSFCSLIDVALKLVGLYGEDVKWENDENEEDYERKKIEAKVIQKEKIYTFLKETDGLTRKSV